MNINCLIIDDEPLAINVIKSYIEEIDTITPKTNSTSIASDSWG